MRPANTRDLLYSLFHIFSKEQLSLIHSCFDVDSGTENQAWIEPISNVRHYPTDQKVVVLPAVSTKRYHPDPIQSGLTGLL